MTQERFEELERLSKELSEQIYVFSFTRKMIEREIIYADNINGVNIISRASR